MTGFLKIIPKNKKLLKSSKVRAWFREAEKRVEEELIRKGILCNKS